MTKLSGRHITSKCDSDNPPDLGPWDRGRRPVAKLHPGCRPCRLQGGQPAWLLRKGVFCNIASKFWLYEDPCFTVWRSLLDLFLPKVVDHTYSRGEREEITTTVDIGIANECLAECTRLGSQCLAVTLQVQNTGKPFFNLVSFLRTSVVVDRDVSLTRHLLELMGPTPPPRPGSPTTRRFAKVSSSLLVSHDPLKLQLIVHHYLFNSLARVFVHCHNHWP